MKASRANCSYRGWVAAALTLALAASAVADKNYLIVSASSYVGSALTQFINHRTARGFNVMVYSVPAGTAAIASRVYSESVGTTDQQYLLIVGDTSGNLDRHHHPHWVGGGSRQPQPICRMPAWMAAAIGTRTCTSGDSRSPAWPCCRTWWTKQSASNPAGSPIRTMRGAR